jgi:adenosyl cobinamide kinase/adenosyl cobinamide phosphate guanylyltransferase
VAGEDVKKCLRCRMRTRIRAHRRRRELARWSTYYNALAEHALVDRLNRNFDFFLRLSSVDVMLFLLLAILGTVLCTIILTRH